jgi:LmbE family N-acetylglucosaminyl deacetylase
MIGAHPDDTDLRCGGLAIRLAGRGHEVRFLSLTSGNAGHQSMSREALRLRRLSEMAEAAAYATAMMGMAGEAAYAKAKSLGLGSFRVYLIDALSTILEQDVQPRLELL